jgi:hypothetical protein
LRCGFYSSCPHIRKGCGSASDGYEDYGFVNDGADDEDSVVMITRIVVMARMVTMKTVTIVLLVITMRMRKNKGLG